MIRSNVNIENKALQPDLVQYLHNNRKGNITNWGLCTQQSGLNNAEIKKITKYQDLKNEVKRSWKLKKHQNCTSHHYINGNDE